MFKLHPRNWLVNDTLWKTSHLIVGYWLNHGSYIYSSNGPTRVVTIISDGISTSDVSKLLCTPKGPAILSAGTSRTRCSSTSWNWGRWAWLWTQANFTGTLTALATTRDGSQSLIPCSHLVEQAIVNRRCRVRIAKSWKLVFATISQRVNCGNSRGFHHQVCQLRYQRPTFTSPAPKLSCRAMMPGRTWQTCKKRDSGWAASLFGLQSLDLLWATHLLMLFSKWFAQTWPTMPKHVESYQAPPDWSVALWSTPQSMTGRWSGRASNWVCHASVWLTPTSTRHTPWQQLPTCSLRMMGENCFHFFLQTGFRLTSFNYQNKCWLPQSPPNSSSGFWQDWKGGVGVIGKMTPRYKPSPEDETPVVAEQPSLSICLEQDGVLVIPPDIRSKYLADPTRSPEWRKLLQQFDRKWGASDDQPTPPRAQERSDQPELSSTSGSTTDQDSSTWASIFPGEPTDQDSLNSKYGAPAITFTISGTLTGVVVEGPKLFLVSSGDSTAGIDAPILCFGAGTWLLDARATTFIQAIWGWFYLEFLWPKISYGSSLFLWTSTPIVWFKVQTNLHSTNAALRRKIRTRATRSAWTLTWLCVFWRSGWWWVIS